jgi:hypothetical protein
MKKRIHALVSFAAVLTFAFACTTTPTNLSTNSSAPANGSVPVELKPALDSITANDIMQHTKVMSADEYEGRGPGTKGEELTVKYLTEQYQRMGLKPGNPDGTYLQKVPLVGFTGTPTASFTAGGKQLNLKFPQDYVAVSRRFVPESKVENSDMVFVGYGVAPAESTGPSCGRPKRAS